MASAACVAWRARGGAVGVATEEHFRHRQINTARGDLLQSLRAGARNHKAKLKHQRNALVGVKISQKK